MFSIIINSDSKKDIIELLEYLMKNPNFSKSVLSLGNAKSIPKSKFKSWEDFESSLGFWKGRKITAESLRKKAWRVC